MSDSASKFSDFSAEPDYSAPPLKSAPPVGVHPHMSYKDAFNACLSSQQMSNSLTPYSQQQIPSQPGHLDKLSMDVLYHTQQSGASLSGISSIVPQLLQAKGGKPYLGKVHLKELDGDEIDLEKQRIKLMFYEKKNEERTLCEEEESSPTQEAGTVSPQKAFTSSSPPNAHQFQPHTDLEEERGNVFFDEDGQIPETRDLLQELETLEHMAAEQRRRCKELKYARERESLNLKKAEVEFQEQELLEPAAGGVMSTSIIHQERWQKEQNKRLRQLERFRAEQKDSPSQKSTGIYCLHMCETVPGFYIPYNYRIFYLWTVCECPFYCLGVFYGYVWSPVVKVFSFPPLPSTLFLKLEKKVTLVCV